MPEFVIKTTEVDEGSRDYSFEVSTAWIREAFDGLDLQADDSAGPGKLDVSVYPSGTDYLVQARIQARYHALCSRCLEPAGVDVAVQQTALMTRGVEPELSPEEELELASEDLDREYFQGDELVLDTLVRETIILECPMQPLCREDCGGIEIPAHLRAPRLEHPDGSGQEVDPRLAPLMNLHSQLAKNEE